MFFVFRFFVLLPTSFLAGGSVQCVNCCAVLWGGPGRAGAGTPPNKSIKQRGLALGGGGGSSGTFAVGTAVKSLFFSLYILQKLTSSFFFYCPHFRSVQKDAAGGGDARLKLRHRRREEFFQPCCCFVSSITPQMPYSYVYMIHVSIENRSRA